MLFAILQMYEFSSKSQLDAIVITSKPVVGDTANVRVFKQITTICLHTKRVQKLLAILQMYEFSSKSQPNKCANFKDRSCWRYCKCTSFQANHNISGAIAHHDMLFAILQKYELSSKSQQVSCCFSVLVRPRK